METLVLIYFMIEAISCQFLDQPSRGEVFVPLLGQGDFTCIVQIEYVIDWLVVFPSGQRGHASNAISKIALTKWNFMFRGIGTRRSTLSIRERDFETNNGTTITCMAHRFGEINGSIAGNTVQVIFYGAPPPPTRLTASENGLFSLDISWSLGFIKGVPVTYTLTAQTDSAHPAVISGIVDTHYEYTTSQPCDAYRFTVVAVTAAGNSRPSQEYVFSRNNDEVCSTTTTTSTTTLDSNTTISDDLSDKISIELSAILPAVLLFVVIALVCLVVCLVCTLCKRRCCRKRTTRPPREGELPYSMEPWYSYSYPHRLPGDFQLGDDGYSDSEFRVVMI